MFIGEIGYGTLINYFKEGQKMNVMSTKMSIMAMLLFLEDKYQRTYCWPTRATMINILKERYDVYIALSTLDKHLADLRDGGWIRSWFQPDNLPDGTFRNKPSNRQLTERAILYMKTRLMRVSNRLIAWAKRYWKTSKKIQPKLMRRPDPPAETKRDQSKNPFLDPRFRGLRGFKTPIPRGV